MDINAVIDQIRLHGASAAAAEGADNLLPLILEQLKPGDVALVMSNGGFGGIHERLLTALKNR